MCRNQATENGRQVGTSEKDMAKHRVRDFKLDDGSAIGKENPEQQ